MGDDYLDLLEHDLAATGDEHNALPVVAEVRRLRNVIARALVKAERAKRLGWGADIAVDEMKTILEEAIYE